MSHHFTLGKKEMNKAFVPKISRCEILTGIATFYAPNVSVKGILAKDYRTKKPANLAS